MTLAQALSLQENTDLCNNRYSPADLPTGVIMAYSEQLAERIRTRLATLSNIEEKEMMGGLTFMYNDKMCVGIIKDEMMCRIDPALHEMAIEKTGCRTMDLPKGR